MYLAELLNGLSYTLYGDGEIEISSLACDTRNVKPGCMFFCLTGGKRDGHQFYGKVVGDGAAALVTERQLDTEITQIVVENARSFMASVAKSFYRNVCDKMKLICVVGTNGKTSTTYIIDAVLNEEGYNTGVIGSNGIFINGQHYDNALTTPDPIELHYWLYQMYLNKVHFVVMEVSAHAIYYQKMQGLTADVAVFTNFSQDHLDFFKDMKTYGSVKKSFFTERHAKAAVLNADDVLGREIAAATNLPYVTYGCAPSADVKAENINCLANGINYDLTLYTDKIRIESGLCGRFNVYNTMAAAATARLFGISTKNIAKGIASIDSVAGRNETITRSDGLRIVVDFAHTPDGITNILSFLKHNTEGRLIVVFGCGGNRDKFKRPLMAKAVSEFADFAVVTNDNPRFEAPQDIANDIERALTCRYKIILNRSQATSYALAAASCLDTVAILGKGAERYQEIKGKKFPYSDTDVVRKLLKNGDGGK